MSRRDRYEQAVELIDDAEQLVRDAETALGQATDPTERDIRETELQAIMAMQDEACELAAPAVELRRRQVAEAGCAAINSLRGEPGSRWDAKHRRYHSASTKAFLVGRLGSKLYMRAFPW